MIKVSFLYAFPLMYDIMRVFSNCKNLRHIISNTSAGAFHTSVSRYTSQQWNREGSVLHSCFLSICSWTLKQLIRTLFIRTPSVLYITRRAVLPLVDHGADASINCAGRGTHHLGQNWCNCHHQLNTHSAEGAVSSPIHHSSLNSDSSIHTCYS